MQKKKEQMKTNWLKALDVINLFYCVRKSSKKVWETKSRTTSCSWCGFVVNSPNPSFKASSIGSLLKSVFRASSRVSFRASTSDRASTSFRDNLLLNDLENGWANAEISFKRLQSGAINLTSCQLWEGVDLPIFEMFLGVLWKAWIPNFPKHP